MPHLQGMDGVCGNFNGDSTDEVGKLVHRRFGSGVPADQLLFPSPIPLHLPTARINPKKCTPERQTTAIRICNKELQSSPDWTLAECMGDVCQVLTHQAGEQKE